MNSGITIVVYVMAITARGAVAQQCSTSSEYTSCGGNIIADSGIIRYQHKSPLKAQMGCIWLIRSNLNSQIQVRMLDDGFTASAYIEINRLFLDGEQNGNVNYSLRAGDYSPRIVDGPVILLTLRVYQNLVNATGFVLLFQGCGPPILNPPTFTHFYRERKPGITEEFSYPKRNTENYRPREFVTYLGQRSERSLASTPPLSDWKVQLTFQDIQNTQYCLFGDRLIFYGGGPIYPGVDSKQEFIWRFCERNSTANYTIPSLSPKYGNVFPNEIGILIVFASDSSVEGKGFHLTW